MQFSLYVQYTVLSMDVGSCKQHIELNKWWKILCYISYLSLWIGTSHIFSPLKELIWQVLHLRHGKKPFIDWKKREINILKWFYHAPPISCICLNLCPYFSLKKTAKGLVTLIWGSKFPSITVIVKYSLPKEMGRPIINCFYHLLLKHWVQIEQYMTPLHL